MPKLTDTQAILLSTAAQRTDDSLLPPPDTLGAITDRIRKAVETLIKRALASEVEVVTPERAWRCNDDLHWGAVITDAGRAAIGVEADKALADINDRAADPAAGAIPDKGTGEPADQLAAPPSEARQTKAALALALLRREQGATIAEMVEATGWLPHTMRAALTGLRKKGHSIAKSKRDDVTCYTVASAA